MACSAASDELSSGDTASMGSKVHQAVKGAVLLSRK